MVSKPMGNGNAKSSGTSRMMKPMDRQARSALRSVKFIPLKKRDKLGLNIDERGVNFGFEFSFILLNKEFNPS